MSLIPTNEKLLMIEGDNEAWVDTHHDMGRSHDTLTVGHMIWSDQGLENLTSDGEIQVANVTTLA